MASHFPEMRKKLALANLNYDPVSFIEKRVLPTTLFLTITLALLSALAFVRFNISMVLLAPLTLVYLLGSFEYLMFYPDALILRRKREMDYEILFAGRHLLIALKSGMPLFDAMAGLTRGYGEVSREFKRIVERTNLGTPMSQAIREVAQASPSSYFVRIITQIANSLASGADVANAVEIATDQITREQMIQLKEYGQKLTPLVMFFMVLGIILPSIGIVIMTVLFSFIGGSSYGITSFVLVLVGLGIAIVQFLFLGAIETSRPKYLL